MLITPEEINHIKKIAEKISENYYRAAEQDKIIDDIAHLKLEIMEYLGNLAPLLLDYVSLLDKERSWYDPVQLYKAGKKAGTSGQERDSALLEYIRFEATGSKTVKLYRDMQRCHDRIIQALGDKKGLSVELLELYRFAYGGPNRSAELFFSMGYAAGRKK